MPQKQLSSRIRGKAELQYAELIGRLYACERLELEPEHILAAGLGCYFILSYCTQHPSPGRLHRPFHH